MSAFVEQAASNLWATFTDLSLHKLVRIVMVLGGYILLRPYLLKLSGRSQMDQHEAPLPEGAKAAISPNSLRGQVDIPEDSGDEDEDGATGADWGKKARRRQRDVLKRLLDAEEERLAAEQEDEEDKDIEEFLVKE